MIRWERSFLIIVILVSVALALLGWEYSRVYQLENELVSLKNQYVLLQNNYNELESRYVKVWMEQPTLPESEQSLEAPYTSLSDGTITWVWKDRDGYVHRWMMPIDSYRSWVNTPKPHKSVALQCNDEVYLMRDYRPYVHPDEFTVVIPNLYQQGRGGREFVQEVFNLVSQLTIFAEDVGEEPRWPIETLTEGRGDCEDLAILLASLLKAAPHSYKLSFVYVDVDNLDAPQSPDHVIVAIEDEDWRVFAECSSDQGWRYYDYIKGWFFEF